jgi:hypothetical protein
MKHHNSRPSRLLPILGVPLILALFVVLSCPFRPRPEPEPEFEEEVPFWQMPDLAITRVDAKPSRTSPGEWVTIDAVVANKGFQISGDGDVVIRLDDLELHREHVGGLAGRREIVVSATWEATLPGRYVITAELELDTDAFDPARSNNVQTCLVRVGGGDESTPEIEVEIVDAQFFDVEKAENAHLAIRVANPSFSDVFDIPVRISVDDEEIWNASIDGLPSGEEVTFPISWAEATPGEHLIKFEADLRDDYPYADSQELKVWHGVVPDKVTEYPEPLKGKWSCLGPSILKGGLPGWTEGSVGRMESIAIHPTDPNFLIAGSPTGGIWKSVNGGNSWFPVGDKLHDLRANALAYDPQNPQLVYCMTGFWSALTSDPFASIFKSVGGGATWHVFATGFFQGGNQIAVVRKTIGDILIYAGTNQGLYRYSNSDPLLTSSTPGDWTQIKTGKIRDLAVSPDNVELVYASVDGKGLYRTASGTTATGDAAWTKLTNGLPGKHMTIDVFLSDPDVLFVCDRPTGTPNPAKVDVYRTDDAGDSWTYLFSRSDTGAPNDTQYNPFIRIHPTLESIYFGGGRLYKAEQLHGSWIQTEVTALHVDQKALEFDPSNVGRFYALNDGGIYRGETVRGGSDTCVPRNADLRTTQFYDIDVSPTNPNLMIGGNQDNNTILYTGNPTWDIIRMGDGNYCLIANANNKVMYSQPQYLADTVRSMDGGQKWVAAGKGLPTEPIWGPGLGGDDGAYITKNPADPSGMSLLSQGWQVYATTNGGGQWNPMGPNLISPDYINRVVVQPGTFDWIAGDAAGIIWIRKSGTWSILAWHPQLARVAGMAFAPTNPNVLYVIYDTPTLFNLVDRIHRFEMQPNGTWTDTNITSDFPWTHVYLAGNQVQIGPVVMLLSVSGDAYDDTVLYVGTDKGVMRGAYDAGTSKWKWTPYNNGFPLGTVVDLVVDPSSKQLRAATFGRGAWSVITGP